jgi:hypothetical protein
LQNVRTTFLFDEVGSKRSKRSADRRLPGMQALVCRVYRHYVGRGATWTDNTKSRCSRKMIPVITELRQWLDAAEEVCRQANEQLRQHEQQQVVCRDLSHVSQDYWRSLILLMCESGLTCHHNLDQCFDEWLTTSGFSARTDFSPLPQP